MHTKLVAMSLQDIFLCSTIFKDFYIQEQNEIFPSKELPNNCL